MPTYDYVCDACEHAFELFQAINDPVQKKCPKCGKLKLRRLFGTGGAIVFKGSGFYKTDYRSDSYHKAAKADGPPSIDSGSKKEGGSDSGSDKKSKSPDTKSSTSSDSKGGSDSSGASKRKGKSRDA